jgi:hypothetical protein
MGKLKSERHHWWPECVSTHWADQSGCANRLWPNGECLRAPPKNFGVIGNGHLIKFGKHPEDRSAWDQNYESEFQNADSNFSNLIHFLEALEEPNVGIAKPISARFLQKEASDAELLEIVKCIVALAIRSPRNRASAVGLAEQLRGPLPPRERNALIGVNMRNDYKKVVSSIGNRGKLVVLFSRTREFIFGDGFYHNFLSPVQGLLTPKILAPITPHLAVLFAIPIMYRPDPKLFTLSISGDETLALNNAVQIYSRSELFYRTEKPVLINEFRQEKHFHYSSLDNPVDYIIRNIPGVVHHQGHFGF